MINHRELRRMRELDGAPAVVTHCTEALQNRDLVPEDFSLRELAENLIPDGREYVELLNPRKGGLVVAESFDGVDVTAFLNITGQIIYSKIMAAFQQEDFVCSRLVDTIPTKFDGEKIPSVQNISQPGALDGDVVPPGMPFPHLGFGERYIETPATTKRGYIVPVTKEAIFFDRTFLVLQQCATVGETLGINKEKRIADVVTGIVNPYSENGGAVNTYQTSAPWINAITTAQLKDWTDVEALELLLANMLDPDTSEPILISGQMTLLVMPAKKHTARMILNNTGVSRGDGASFTVRTDAANPLDNYALAVSKQAYRRIIASGVTAANAANYWYLGDFKKAFAYMENWPITVVQAPQNSEAEFTSDVMFRFKASERGAAAVLRPRHVARTTGATD